MSVTNKKVKQVQKPRIRLKADIEEIFPSTSKASSGFSSIVKTTPKSPELHIDGRVAKNNARLLNGLDINGKRSSSTYSEEIIGTIPDFQLVELNEKCPISSKFIEMSNKFIPSDTWHAFQHELEELISDNLDKQKTIHGEITYLTTGEYPTVKLSDRSLPKFHLNEFSPTTRKINSNRARFIDSWKLSADIGLFSSSDDEENPSILDIPQRFWKWSREYLRHISPDYVKEFREKLVCRFDEENLLWKYCKDTVAKANGKCIKKKPTTLCSGVVQNESVIISQSPNKNKRKRSNRSDQEITRVKMVRNQSPQSSRTSDYSRFPTAEVFGTFRDFGHNNIDDSHKAAKNALSNKKCNNLPSGMEYEIESDDGHELDDERDEKPLADSMRLLNGFKINSPSKKLSKRLSHGDIEHDGDELDEVSREIKKKQLKLEEIYESTYPLIEDLFERIKSEHAIYEMSKRLDVIDDKIFDFGHKHERLKSFNKEQRGEYRSLFSLRSKTVQSFLPKSDD